MDRPSVKISTFEFWPTRLIAFEFEDADFDRRLQAFVMRQALAMYGDKAREFDPNSELRIYDLFALDDECVHLLKERVLWAARMYLGKESEPWIEGMDLDGRAVILPDRSFIQTHVERRESDLTIAYFPTGDAVGQPISHPGNPRFVVEDPSRALTDLRLPFEERHSVHLAPRPGLLLVFPAHVPHHQQPYCGKEPHLQIVCNVRIQWKSEYHQRW